MSTTKSKGKNPPRPPGTPWAETYPSRRRVRTTRQAGLSDMRRAFVGEYLRTLNASKAAVAAGCSARSAVKKGSDLLRTPAVAAAIEAAMAARAQRVQIDADDVLRMWVDVARADPNGLVEYRRGCCRYCYGEQHRYQRTAGEIERDREAWLIEDAKRARRNAERPPFDPKGGPGWNPNRPAVPECPECFGDGQGRVVVQDTRHLAPDVLRLYAGVKETKDGLQVLMASQERARELIGQHLGMLKARVAGDGEGGAIPVEHRVAPDLSKLSRETLRALKAAYGLGGNPDAG